MAAAFAAVLSLSSSLPARAADALDQSVPTPGIIPSSSAYLQMAQMAQTFTPGITGQLDKVSLYQGSSTFTKPSFRLEVWTVDTSKTTLANLGAAAPSFQFQGETAKTWHDFTLSPSVAVVAGTQYALVVTATSFPLSLRWGFMSSWNYPGGNMWLCCTGGQWAKDPSRNFAFQTYVAGGTTPPAANAVPKLDPPASSAVRVDEGTQPTNSGNYSDPDGDTVALTASTGSLTRTGTSNGTWTWTEPKSDEGPTQTVTITADDQHNPSVATTFTVDVVAVEPTATITPSQTTAPLLAPASQVKEGTPLTFSGGAHSPSSDDNNAGFTYAWTVTKDGAGYPAGGPGTSFSFTPNDEGAYVVSFSATDDGGKTGSDSVTVNVGDVLPTATITSVVPALTAPKIIVPYELVGFSGSFTDPGTADPHTATWRFGDRNSAAGWSVSHYYTAPGTYTVTLEVAQGEDPGVGTATTTVTVLTPSQALSAIAGYVKNLPGLNAGQKNSLIAKLDAASAAAGRGDTNAANNQLNAFLNELQADVNTGKISASDAATLRNAVHAVKGALGTFNRFLEWWPLGL